MLTCLLKFESFNGQITFRILTHFITFYFISALYLKSISEGFSWGEKILKVELNRFFKLVLDNETIESLLIY